MAAIPALRTTTVLSPTLRSAPTVRSAPQVNLSAAISGLATKTDDCTVAAHAGERPVLTCESPAAPCPRLVACGKLLIS